MPGSVRTVQKAAPKARCCHLRWDWPELALPRGLLAGWHALQCRWPPSNEGGPAHRLLGTTRLARDYAAQLWPPRRAWQAG